MAYNPYDSDFSDDIGLGAEDRDRVQSNKLDWYKNDTKNRIDRVALVYFNPVDINALKGFMRENPTASEEEQKALVAKVRAERATTLGKSVQALDAVDLLDTSEVRFKAVDASYKEKIGYVPWPRHIPTSEKAVWDKLELVAPHKTYVVTALLVYPTNSEGEIDKTRLKNGWSIRPWRFSQPTLQQIQRINRTLVAEGSNMGAIDLHIECEEPKFFKYVISKAGPSILAKNADFRRVVLEKAVAMYPKLNPFKAVTTEELKEKLGMGGGGGSIGANSSDEDFTGILGNV